MDYTLALYNQEPLEQLSIKLTLDKLIANHGYPEEIRSLHFRSELAIRGIVIDCPNGNVFKMNHYGFVGRVYHGTQELSSEERFKQYRSGGRIRLSSDRYRWIDTLFGLPDAVMYMTMVDWIDTQSTSPDYQKLFLDIRKSIDEAHRDNTLKDAIRANMKGFIKKDPNLAAMLHKYRSSGKKQFILTNSYWPYTEAVMEYLLDGERSEYPSWRNYFDHIIVGGCKPGFFNDENPFLEVNPDTGVVSETPATSLRPSAVYQGGNIKAFEEMTGVTGGRVLYVGDHIYGDMIRLKKSRGWRTALVLQELVQEQACSEEHAQEIRDLEVLDRRRRNLQSEIDYEALLLKQIQKVLDQCEESFKPRLLEAKKNARSNLDSLKGRSKAMHDEVIGLERSIERSYNVYCGTMFRAGPATSRFGQQVSDYADVYTSKVSNFLSYSPVRYFRAGRREMPHEF